VCDLADSAVDLVPALDRDAVRSLVTAPIHERSREAAAIWNAANVLAWARHALEPLQKGAAHDVLLN
jgi:hypothetical protein